jgi:hypothetical protein
MMERKISLVKALSKVIWIHNDLFAKWYVRDGEDFEGDDSEVLVPEVKERGGCPFETTLPSLCEELEMKEEMG